jgi:peptidoglycan-associated lipoprotein
MAIFMGVGCKHTGDSDLDDGMDADGGSGMESSTTGDDLPNISSSQLEEMLFNEDSGLQRVYFDFDSSSLRADALETLRQNAEIIKKAPGVLIQIAGHCDERGTQEYNLALGERRSLSVRKHLMQLGVSGDRMITISYGEESPAAMGQTQAAWSQNRRCEFNKAISR